MLKNTIEITEDIENIKKLFQADNFNAKTSKVKLEEKNQKLFIIIESEDIVSLRASINGITTMLSIYYQTKTNVEK
jgi:tRNA threonylcarbamoyladenosine modification (KEOPS) complex  Pcc1 subunit